MLGRTVSTKTRVVPSPPVTGSVVIPEPDTVFISSPVLPTRPDTIYLEGKPYPVYVIDTVEVIKDYSEEKRYAFNVFDNTDGTMDVSLSLRYNALQNFDYSFRGFKTIQTRTQRFTPFASASYHTFGAVGVGGGFFWDNIGFEYQYNFQRSLHNYHTLGLKIKL